MPMHESLRTQRSVQLCNQVQSHTVYDHLLKCIQTAGLALFDTCCALEATKKKLHVFRCVRCPNNLAQRCWPIYFQPNHSRHLALLTRGRLASSEKGGDCATPTVKYAELAFLAREMTWISSWRLCCAVHAAWWWLSRYLIGFRFIQKGRFN